jgi:hypothetical protein
MRFDNRPRAWMDEQGQQLPATWGALMVAGASTDGPLVGAWGVPYGTSQCSASTAVRTPKEQALSIATLALA